MLFLAVLFKPFFVQTQQPYDLSSSDSCYALPIEYPGLKLRVDKLDLLTSTPRLG